MDAIKRILEESGSLNYEIQKLKNPLLLWRHAATAAEQSEEKLFCDRFAYADSRAACFTQVEFDPADSLAVSAERYGGDGIGQNGGGGRCGTLSDVQLKGIGPNCLVGDHDNKVHSYGGLDARKAIVETLFTHILEHVLPLGTIPIHGLILVGEKAGFNGQENCWGVIMVRDACLRPGHFLRAGVFKPKPEVESYLLSDIGRIRRLYKDLNTHFESANDFIRWIGTSLQNIARQFSLAFAARIAHGTVTPSNISIDGRWLDLPDAGFLGVDTPFHVKHEFYEEHQKALKCFLEMVYHYGKYNGVLLNAAPLVGYYQEQFDACFRQCVAQAFGFKMENLPFIASEDWDVVAATYSRVMHTWKDTMESDAHTTVLHDPVHALVIGTLLHCLDSELAGEVLKNTKIPGQDLNVYLDTFSGIWAQYLAHMQTAHGLSVAAVSLRSLLIVFRNTLLAELFSPSAIDEQAAVLCANGRPGQVGPFIDDYLDTAKWVLGDAENPMMLFRNHRLVIGFSVSDGRFFAQRNGVLSNFSDFPELYRNLSDMETDAFVLHGKSYSAWLAMLNKLLSSVTFNTSKGLQ